jgi:type IV pilus assembly protein PilA
MFLQNLRAKIGARLNGDREAGFTLIELLVVMLILGILAAIAIPAFFNQKNKANDASSKAYAKTAQTAMETYATDNGGSYAGADEAALRAIEDTLTEAELDAAGTSATSYTITVTTPDSDGRTFSINRTGSETLFPCSIGTSEDRGGCPSSNYWSGEVPAAE